MRQVGEIFLAPTAILSGDVTVGRGVSLWYGASVRGDVAAITLGDFVNVQDNAVVHCDAGFPQVVGAGVVVGHAAVLHGVRVGADTLIGIGAKLLSGTVIGDGCIIGAGAVVPPGMVVPPGSVVLGAPGKVTRAVTPDELAKTKTIAARYHGLAQKYAAGQVAWPFGPPHAG
jgi:carbonic anhydrase/acetyltransferase-like protein (isoleucine patch superfamily)